MVRVTGNSHNDAPNETTSLLSSPTESWNEPRDPEHRASRCTWPWVNVVALCIALAIAADIGEYLFLAPKVRLFESIICTSYYLREDPSLVSPDGSVQEKFCKIDPVQDKLAMILGWQYAFDSVPAILLAVPYGYLADKYGRKWITVLGIMGYALSWIWTLFVVGVSQLPLQYVWLSSVFFLVGGGPPMATTLVTTIVADVAPPDKRSSAFLYRYTSELIAECLVPPITSILMSKTPWLPLLIALGFQLLCFTITLVLPETLPLPQKIYEPDPDESSNPQLDSGLSETNDSPLPLVNEKWKVWFHQTRDSFSFATRDKAVTGLLLTFLVSKLARQSINLLFQYASKRYGWSLSKAGLLLSLRAGVNIVLFTAVLPYAANFALSKTSPASKELWIAKASILLMIFGAIVLFGSVTPVVMVAGLIIYTLGTGFPPVVRSLITCLVESHHASKTSDIGRLYALISVMEGLGSLIAGPSMAWAFRYGMSLGKSWLGFPFALAAGLFVAISPVLFMVRV